MTTKNLSVDEALAEAHLPALLMAMAHLTGDLALLGEEARAVYEPDAEPQEGGYSPALQAKIRARAKAAYEAHKAGAALPPPPSRETFHRMMSYVAGADVPERYVDFLLDEMQIGLIDTKTPHWEGLENRAKDMHVVVIGAGMSGLLTAFRLQQAGVSFTVVDKNPEVGGTWFENTYPGCRVDNPNHMYSFSFEPNHDFPYYFSTQPVLLDYFQRFAAKHDLKKHVRFSTTVESAIWSEAAGEWTVTLVGADGKHETLKANAVVSAVGQLNQPRYPDTIPGFGSFKGPAFHTARWDHSVDLKGKRVLVIGTGASAYQFAPEIAGEVASLKIFQRTPPWTQPAPHYHEAVPEGLKWLMEHFPFFGKWYRFYLFWSLTDGVYDAVRADDDWNGPPNAVGKTNAEHAQMLLEAMRIQAPERPDLIEKVAPNYPFGGKRGLVDNGSWIAALKRENVDLITTPIAEITDKGVRTSDGVEHEADVLIYGTGFHASRFLWPMNIVGREGKSLQEVWDGDPRAYLGMTTPGFPNLFILYGPNTNIVVNGSIIFFSECSVRYVVECLKLMAARGARSMEVRRDVCDAFNVAVDKENAKMAWGSPHVSSWYKNVAGRVTQNWPWPIVDYWTATVAPNPDDFVLEPA